MFGGGMPIKLLKTGGGPELYIGGAVAYMAGFGPRPGSSTVGVPGLSSDLGLI